MAALDDARAIALSLPGTTQVVDGHRGGACWRTRNGRFAWERGPSHFFTIPHFDGWPAVLVDLDRIEVGHLREAVTEAWLVTAPAHVAKAWLAEHPELDGDVGGGS